MICRYPQTFNGNTVPCGRCFACLSNKRRSWFVRLKEELKASELCSFVTLTYDDGHLPRSDDGVPIVSKRDCQLFFKRLRKHLDFRYFLCSEYGTETLRPHYHLILFYKYGNYDLLPLIDRSWSLGFCSVSDVNDARLNYVAKYCVNPSFTPPYYCEKEARTFILTSRRPGIGSSYLTESSIAYHRANLQPFYVEPGGVKVPLPRFMRDKIFSKEEARTIRNQNHAFHEKALDRYIEKYHDYDTTVDTPYYLQIEQVEDARIIKNLKKSEI